MGKVIRQTIEMYGNNATAASEILDETYGFYTGLNIPLLTSITRDAGSPGTVTITIDNKITYYHSMTVQNGCYIRIGLEGEGSSAAASRYTYATFTIGYSDTLFYLQIHGGGNQQNILVYEKIGNKILFGNVFSGNSASFRDIASVTLRDLDTDISYKHGKVIGYDNDAFHIDYYPTDILIQVAGFSLSDNNFITCTSVTTDAIITFGAYNYYSVGANTLLKIDN